MKSSYDGYRVQVHLLLLGLKGTMSEAELHILKARMRGGQLNKAKRGELEMRPPVGLVYMAEGTLGLDPRRSKNDPRD